jgi:predicted GTPase
MAVRKVLILGAAGRDFHNFNVAFRDRDDVEVVGFTATQIPNIAGRTYPAALAGTRYPKGIPIFPESELAELLRKLEVTEAVFSYSDVSHEYVMQRASLVLATGADFRLMGADSTMLSAKVPVVSICAARTGSGKSQTTRKVCGILAAKGRRVVAVRHPMPYGDLERQRVQRFAQLSDLDDAKCSIEEREEYEPHLKNGTVIYAGVDYEAILRQAEKEADLIVWDGGNNDLPFYRPELEIVVVDPLRPGHETSYHPGTTNVIRAGCVIVNKVDAAAPEAVDQVRRNVRALNPRAVVIEAASPLSVEDPMAIAGKRVLVVEDGPTLTHGEMKFGAGVAAARKFGAAELVDPRRWAKGSIRKTFEQYPGTGTLLPAVGYGEAQMEDLRATIEATECDLVLIATPIDLRRTIRLTKPALRVTYELQEIGKPDLEDVLARF